MLSFKASLEEAEDGIMSSHSHRMTASYHRSQARKLQNKGHAWNHPDVQYHTNLYHTHSHRMNVARQREREAAKADKKAHGADRAPHQTGSHVYKVAGTEHVGGYRRTSKLLHGQVTKHTADAFHVKWEHGGETKHRQSDAREYGTGRPSHWSMHHSGGQVHAMPREFKTPAEHKAHVASQLHQAKHEEAHRARIQRAQSNLASHSPHHISSEHLERMERLHSEIMAHKNSLGESKK